MHIYIYIYRYIYITVLWTKVKKCPKWKEQCIQKGHGSGFFISLECKISAQGWYNGISGKTKLIVVLTILACYIKENFS